MHFLYYINLSESKHIIQHISFNAHFILYLLTSKQTYNTTCFVQCTFYYVILRESKHIRENAKVICNERCNTISLIPSNEDITKLQMFTLEHKSFEK